MEKRYYCKHLEMKRSQKGFDGLDSCRPQSVQGLNEPTFLVTYASGILAKEIGAAVEKIENLLGKQVVITCDEVTTNPLPQVVEYA